MQLTAKMRLICRTREIKSKNGEFFVIATLVDYSGNGETLLDKEDFFISGEELQTLVPKISQMSFGQPCEIEIQKTGNFQRLLDIKALDHDIQFKKAS